MSPRITTEQTAAYGTNVVVSAPLLIADEDPRLASSFRRVLSRGRDLIEARTLEEAEIAFVEGVDLAVVSLQLIRGGDLSLIRKLRHIDPEPPIIVVAGRGSIEEAIAAMKLGAFHYLPKPVDAAELRTLVDRALEQSLPRASKRWRRGAGDAVLPGLEAIVGESRSMVDVKRLLAKVARSNASTVVLSGESGTGKDLAARAVHETSERAHGPFVNITCSAIPEPLLESELFGHERGAFTDARHRKKGLLEQAHGGTAFLDEIGETGPAFQAKLLRFLEEKAFRRVGGIRDVHPDVRVIAATHRDLEEAVRQGTFRKDLYYRLTVAPITLPPLREREGDVGLLTAFFMRRLVGALRSRVTAISSDAQRLLDAHSWPGNVRELRNAIEGAMLFADLEVLRVEDFPSIAAAPRTTSRLRLPLEGISLEQLENDFVRQALALARGNRTQAAALLGLNRDQVRYRLQKLGL